ncbi:MAG: hypothetical protein HZB61_13295 [Nitrospirae bacterium]|nr:hypothetical protein [Nitrospirota bacterium]
MAEIKSREDKPLPGIEYSEIRIPDEDNLGNGIFTTVLEPKALAKINPILSSISNEPVFQLLVSINAAVHEITVLLGKADKSPATSREVFVLPKKLDDSKAHRVDVVFKDWKITGLKMDGDDLERVTACQ